MHRLEVILCLFCGGFFENALPSECKFIAHEKCAVKVPPCRNVVQKLAMSRRVTTLIGAASSTGREHEW